MPIRWSAVKVSQAIDQVEAKLAEAQPFLDQAYAIAQEARSIPNLAGYIDGGLARLACDIRERSARIQSGIQSARSCIPEGAIEADLEQSRHGEQQPLTLG